MLFRFLRIFTLAVLIGLIFTATGHQSPMPVVQAQENIGTIYIMGEPNTDHFPDITITFRAVNAQNEVPDLDGLSERIRVYENETLITTPLQVTEAAPAIPAHVIFLVDLGGTNLANRVNDITIRESMLYFADQGFFNGINTATILASVNTPTVDTDSIELATLNEDDFEDAVRDEIVFTANRLPLTKGLVSLQEALATMPDGERHENSLAIIYIGRIIEDRRESNSNEYIDVSEFANDARRAGVKLYVFYTATSQTGLAPDDRDILESLVDGSLRRFVILQNDHELNETSLDYVYNEITDYTRTFQVTYRSTIGACAERDVTLIATNGRPENASFSEETRYEVCPPSPAVQIISSTAIDRQVVTNESGWHYEPSAAPIEAQITQDWSFASTPPAINSAELLVNGQPYATALLSADGRVQFSYDLTDVNGNAQVPIVVKVENELHVPGQATANLSIAVAATPTPTFTPIPTPTSTVPWYDTWKTGPPPPEPPPMGWGCITGIFAFGLIALALVIVIRGLPLRLSLSTPPTPIPSPGSSSSIAAKKTRVGDGQAAHSHLIVKDAARPGIIGDIFILYDSMTIIGREVKVTDIQFYPPEEEDSTIGRIHCNIKYIDGRAMIRDRESRHGTWVNDQRVSSEYDMPLNNGDMIKLGNVSQKGVLLEYRTGDVPPEEPTPASGDDQSDSGSRTKAYKTGPPQPANDNSNDVPGIEAIRDNYNE